MRLLLSLIIFASGMSTWANNKWTVETSDKVLNVIISKPMPATGTVSAKDLDDKFIYPCIDPKDEKIEDRVQHEGKYIYSPRVLFTDSFKNQLWICVIEDDFKKISDSHFRALSYFKIFFREKSGKIKTLEDEMEGTVNPFDVRIDGSSLILQKNPRFGDEATAKLIPYSEKRINCTESACKVESEKCVVSLKGIDATQELAKADKAKSVLNLDKVVLLAATGNPQAAKKIQKFIPPKPKSEYEGESQYDGDGSYEGNLLYRYKQFIKEARKLKCTGQ